MLPAVCHNDVITYVFSAGTAAPLVTKVVVTSSDKLTVNGLKVAVEQDIKNTPGLSVTYQTPTASIPGTAIITVVSYPKLALLTTKDGAKIAISDGSQIGVAKLSVTSPAKIPGSPPAPDPIPEYPCTFSITTFQTKLHSD